jgi:GNAT superfamily N-acetyltransferase
MADVGELRVLPLTPGRWRHLEDLFGDNGACGGCWCMWWRITRAEWTRQKGEANRRAFHEYVTSGERPGLLAFAGRRPVGWIAVEPRERYPVLQRSRTVKPIDDEPVWSITCFFIRKGHRRRGVASALIRAAMDHVRARGGEIVEAYPIDPTTDNPLPDAFAWHGTMAMFSREGFIEVARRSPTRPIVRYRIGGR